MKSWTQCPECWKVALCGQQNSPQKFCKLWRWVIFFLLSEIQAKWNFFFFLFYICEWTVLPMHIQVLENSSTIQQYGLLSWDKLHPFVSIHHTWLSFALCSTETRISQPSMTSLQMNPCIWLSPCLIRDSKISVENNQQNDRGTNI